MLQTAKTIHISHNGETVIRYYNRENKQPTGTKSEINNRNREIFSSGVQQNCHINQLNIFNLFKRKDSHTSVIKD